MAQQTMYPAKLGSPQTTLAAQLAADATSMVLADASVLPAAPNLAVIGVDENCEIVKYTAIDAGTNTVSGLVRAQGGSTAKLWDAGSVVARNNTSIDHDTMKHNIEDLAANKQDNLTFDNAPTQNSDNPVKSGGVYSALAEKEGTLTWDTTPTQNSTNPMTSGAIYAHEPFQVTGTASVGSSVTFTDSRIDSEHWQVPKNGIYFGTPANVTSTVHWVTNITSHTITLTATFTGSTSVEIDMNWYQ